MKEGVTGTEGEADGCVGVVRASGTGDAPRELREAEEAFGVEEDDGGTEGTLGMTLDVGSPATLGATGEMERADETEEAFLTS